jgi:hypothetical protein
MDKYHQNMLIRVSIVLVFSTKLPPPFGRTAACAMLKPNEAACRTGGPGAHCHWSLTLTIASTDLSQIGSSRISKNAKNLRQNSIQPPVSCPFKAIRLSLSQYSSRLVDGLPIFSLDCVLRTDIGLVQSSICQMYDQLMNPQSTARQQQAGS